MVSVGTDSFSAIYIFSCLLINFYFLTHTDADVVEKTLAVNYYGTLKACEATLPLIRNGGRLVNVSSMACKLHKYSPELQERFKSGKSVQEYTTLMQEFQKAVKEGNHSKLGWPTTAYSVSKSGVTGFTRALAMQEESKGSNILVNSCCPGEFPLDLYSRFQTGQPHSNGSFNRK